MQVTLLHGYPDYIGKRFAWAGYGNGPKSYVTGGDPVTLPGFQNYIDIVFASGFSLSKLYNVDPVNSANGQRATWKMIWVVFSTGLEVANGVDLSAETVQIGGFGGTY